MSELKKGRTTVGPKKKDPAELAGSNGVKSQTATITKQKDQTMSNIILSEATDIGNAPVRDVASHGPSVVASEATILTSPSEMVVTIDQIDGDVRDGKFLAVTLFDDQIAIFPLGPLSPVNHANVGTAIQKESGTVGTLLGCYLVCGVAGSLVLLRLMSNRPCTEFDWCQGHEDGSRDVVRHVAETVDLFTFDGDDGGNFRSRILSTRFLEENVENVAVVIEYDLELTHPELLNLANELEAAAQKLRDLA